MKCANNNELEGFLAGKLEPGRMVEIDEHLGACAECKCALAAACVRAGSASALRQDVLGIADCPEYEELSAYVEGSLDVNRSRALLAHVNACEPCATDVARIRELRSQAALRGPVKVQPGESRGRARGSFGIWRRAFAGAVVAAGVVAVVIALGPFGKAPPPGTPTAGNTGTVRPAPASSGGSEKPTVGTKPQPTNATVASTSLEYKVVLKDGRYQLIKRGGQVMLAKSDGSPVKIGIASRIAEKLASGKVTPAEQFAITMRTIRLRDSGAYVPPPAAPELVAPVGKIVMSTRPEFRWSGVDLAHSYQLLIRDEHGNQVFEGIATKTSLEPSIRLERGRVYAWQVGSRFNAEDDWSYSAPARIKVLSSDNYAAICKVKQQAPGSHLALGVAYESYGLYDDAAREYQAVRRANPSSRVARRLAPR